MRAIGRSLAALFCAATISQAAYDPMSVTDSKVVSQTREIHDEKRGRDIPVRIYQTESKPAPVVLFSHGLGGSRDNNAWLGEHWAKRGYFVVFMQHAGSDESVWKGAPAGQRMVNMKSAASFGNLKLRGEDVKAVIDELTGWNKEGEWKGRMDLEHIAITGHSFGAHTAQIVAGQEFMGGKISFHDPRVSAAIMLSPAPPAMGDPAKSFEPIKIPCLLMTGTLDESPIGKTTPADRLKVFPALTNAPGWQVVFDKGTHSSFGGRGKEDRYRRATTALTSAFLDANLKGEVAAKEWLNDKGGAGARSVLVEADVWQRNAKAD